MHQLLLVPRLSPHGTIHHANGSNSLALCWPMQKRTEAGLDARKEACMPSHPSGTCVSGLWLIVRPPGVGLAPMTPAPQATHRKDAVQVLQPMQLIALHRPPYRTRHTKHRAFTPTPPASGAACARHASGPCCHAPGHRCSSSASSLPLLLPRPLPLLGDRTAHHHHHRHHLISINCRACP